MDCLDLETMGSDCTIHNPATEFQHIWTSAARRAENVTVGRIVFCESSLHSVMEIGVFSKRNLLLVDDDLRQTKYPALV